MSSCIDLVKCRICGFKEACYEKYTRCIDDDFYCEFFGYSYTTRTEGGRGAFGYERRSGPGSLGRFSDEDTLEGFKKYVDEHSNELKSAYYTQKDRDGVWQKIFLIGRPMPDTLLKSTDVSTFSEK